MIVKYNMEEKDYKTLTNTTIWIETFSTFLDMIIQ